MTTKVFLYWVLLFLSTGYVALMVAFYYFGLIATAVATALYVASLAFFSRCVESGGCYSCLAGATLITVAITFLAVLHATGVELP